MGKTKFNRFKGTRKRKRNRSVIIAAPDLRATLVRPTPTETVRGDKDENPSTSARKLDYFNLNLNEMIEMTSQGKPVDSSGCFLLVHTTSLNKLISGLCCPSCKQTGMVFKTHDEKHRGFAAKGYIYCKKCESVVGEEYLSEKAGESQTPNDPFEVNVRAVFAFMGIGCGFNAMKDWSTLMNLPNSPNKFTYRGVKEKIVTGSKETFNEVSAISVDIIRRTYENNGMLPDKDGILDIAVSYDGTWQKRGHSSHNGAAVVIEILTGLPVDYQVLSNFCHQCLKAPKKKTIYMLNGKQSMQQNVARIMRAPQTPWSKNVQR